MMPGSIFVYYPAAAPSGLIVFQPPTVPISEAEKARRAKHNAARKLRLEKQRQREKAEFEERKNVLAARSWVVAASSATAACVADFSAADRAAAGAWAAAEARAGKPRRATEAPAAAAATAEAEAEDRHKQPQQSLPHRCPLQNWSGRRRRPRGIHVQRAWPFIRAVHHLHGGLGCAG